MNKSLKILLIGSLIIFLYHPLGWCRSSRSNLEDRIENLENKLESNLNIEMASKLEALEREVQELRGIIEEQQHSSISLSKPKIDQKLDVQQLDSEQLAYNTAYKLVEDKNFSEAIVAFKDFVGRYNNGQYTPNATYWLGELYLTEHNFDVAADYFLQVVNKYKDHAKAPDALLKLGILETERENWSEAKNYFNQIKKSYSNSPRVHMAEAKLQSIQREGH
ncbi:MAG: tol-pal system protein YbgF [Gammaproteobacteria bacterium]|jgi:tol-pal system protein YbgF